MYGSLRTYTKDDGVPKVWAEWFLAVGIGAKEPILDDQKTRIMRTSIVVASNLNS